MTAEIVVQQSELIVSSDSADLIEVGGETTESLLIADGLIDANVNLISEVIEVTSERSELSVETDGVGVDVLAIGQQGPTGPQGPAGEEVIVSERVDFITDLLIYRGEADPGAAESGAVWRIRKIVIGEDGDVTTTWANGSATFTNIWDDRASLTYS